jgi:hypothetical protein
LFKLSVAGRQVVVRQVQLLEGEGAMRFITIVLLFSTTTVHAQSLYLNYGEWEQMPTNLREMYVAGAFDAASVIAIPEQAPVAMYYNECVAKTGLSMAQLTQNMKEYAEARPNVQSKPIPNVLMRYLISVCGLPGRLVRE